MAASVVIKQSIVACRSVLIFGYIIPTPLHAPPIAAEWDLSFTFTANSFLFVSVVRMASENKTPPLFDKPLTSLGIFFLIFSVSRYFPIMPVEATRTFRSEERRVGKEC